MKRRKFNQLSASLAAMLAVHPTSAMASHKNPMKRIGLTTVNFRDRFATTGKNIPLGKELTLTAIPKYFANRFNIHNLEFWSQHFESTGSAYLKDLKAAIKKNKSKLINIQLDAKYHISDPDPAKREKSLELVLHWVDVADTLGSGAIRVNPGKGDAAHAIESYKIINQAAKKKGISLLVENHFGMAMDPAIHIQIVKEVGDNMHILPDYGNYSNEVRFDGLKKILPYAYLISAKTMAFDDVTQDHISYDFDQCMKMAQESRFKGIYSLEQWSRNPNQMEDEAMVDWMIEHVKPYC